ncbi:topoisomerase [Pseudoxanthomonas koreensis]|uniref:glucuronyl esterase domain-containing protein n=1 Tax=Pseudoxanthomonas koreensis TaxID=266061 RepID=UPI0035A66341
MPTLLLSRCVVLALLCALPPPADAANSAGAVLPATPNATGSGGLVEDRGRDCPAQALVDAGGPLLPDPFVRADGSRLDTRADWRCQRQRTLRTAQAQLYGDKGPQPDAVTGTITGERIDVTVAHGGRQVSFSANLRLPPGPGPHPAMIVVGGVAGVDDRLLVEHGVARIDYLPTQLGAETGQGRERQGAFFDLYGQQVQSSGTLMAWAWGVSRIIDVIAGAGQGMLRADAIGVTGCSRLGKGALAAGAFDQRVALTIPIESGAGGVPTWRGGSDGAGTQPAHSAYGEQPWLGDAFAAYTGAVERLAIDQHQVLGLVAPRGLLILDNPHVAWLGARQGHASALAGAEIYRALGAAGNLGYHSDVEDGTHCKWRPQWDAPTRAAIGRHLLHEPAPDLAINAADGATATLDDLRDWNTPELE